VPFVSATEALNQSFVDLEALSQASGEPPWRRCLVGTPGLRAVLICWPPGFSSVRHVHPAAEEVFSVIGDDPEREVGPGSFLFAERGVRHLIRVPDGGEPLLLLATVAPNEDWAQETIEPA
jgi:quercetin dioxygenase-like cupin family protein